MQRRRFGPRETILVGGAFALLVAGLVAPLLAPLLGYDLSNRAVSMLAGPDGYRVTSPVLLSAAPRVVLEQGRLSLAPRSGRKTRSAEEAIALIESGNAQLILEDALLSVEAHGGGPTAATRNVGADAAPIFAALARLRFNALKVRRGTIVLARASGAREVLGQITADLSAIGAASVSAMGSFNLRGEDLAFDAVFGLAREAGDSYAPLRATISGALLQASFDGRLTLADGLQLTASAADVRCPRVRELARWLGAPWPSGSGLQNFRARGQLDWQNGVLAFEQAIFAMDGNEASGTLSVGLGERTSVEGTLALSRLDLAAYMPAAAGPQTDFTSRLDTAWIALGGDAPDYAFPLVKHLDADLRISADRVLVRGKEFGRAAVTVAIRGGKMLADLAELELGNGAYGGGHVVLDMDGPEPRYVVRGKLAGLDVARLSAAVLDYPPLLSGRGEIAIDLAATGVTRAQLSGTLAGKVALHLTGRGRLGVDLEALLAAARVKELSGWGAGRGSTAVDELLARFRIAGGSVGVEMARIQSSGRAIIGTGGIDLTTRELDVQLTLGANASAPPETLDPPVGDRLSLQGPWAAPAIRWIGVADRAVVVPGQAGTTKLATPVAGP